MIFPLILIGFAIAMFASPDAMDTADASGRRSLIKQVLIWVWSIPGGVVLLLLGVLITVGVLKGDDEGGGDSGGDASGAAGRSGDAGGPPGPA